MEKDFFLTSFQGERKLQRTSEDYVYTILPGGYPDLEGPGVHWASWRFSQCIKKKNSDFLKKCLPEWKILQVSLMNNFIRSIHSLAFIRKFRSCILYWLQIDNNVIAYILHGLSCSLAAGECPRQINWIWERSLQI